WIRYRKELLAGAYGEVLEIGVGTGLNLPHYPGQVRKLTTVDPNAGMNKRLRKRIEELGIKVDQRVLSGESLSFDEATFDCVVSTMTLCSIPDVQQALAEVFRVLKPGGRYLFLEHGLSPDAKVQKWQHRLNWLQRLCAGGCRLDLDVRAVVASQPFRSIEVDNFYAEHTPRTHGYLYRGASVKE
ncbi:MAG: class I SAM-dependent methyltransferase, partial [Planctomycetes bacterium]|nr:class I SAM-dependent methyltransferase [Planctomycetota bacterium]